jgi:hypothetical protein
MIQIVLRRQRSNTTWPTNKDKMPLKLGIVALEAKEAPVL